jgi:hypothetical protein
MGKWGATPNGGNLLAPNVAPTYAQIAIDYIGLLWTQKSPNPLGIEAFRTS